jgi:hypothetical protein
MTVKLVLMKSGEDIIADVEEMVIEDRTIGYFLTKPCIVKLMDNDAITRDKTAKGFRIKMFPWMPLSKDPKIPVSVDWVVTMTEPVDELRKMFLNEVLKDDQTDSDGESGSDSTD